MLDNILGFYYMLFMPDPSRDRLRIWLDGEEEYRYLYFKDFFALLDKAEVSTEIKVQFNSVLMHTTMFLWDVQAGSIIYVPAGFSLEPYKEIMERRKKEEQDDRDIAEKYWQHDIDMDPKSPKIKHK